MRFTLVSVALLALAHSIAPGVHGSPLLVSDHTDSLRVRQTTEIEQVIGIVSNVIKGLLPGVKVDQLLQSLEQELKTSLDAITGALPIRAFPPTDPTSLTSSSPLTTLSSTTTTTSHGLSAATSKTGTSTTGSVSTVSLSVSQALPTPRARMRRQLPSLSLDVPSSPTGLLNSVASAALGTPTGLPISVVSAALGILGSLTSVPTPLAQG